MHFYFRIFLKTGNLILWAVSGALLLAVLYGPHDAEDYIHIASKAEAALYNGWARTAWSLGLGYIMLACCLGRGGKICLIYILYILNQKNLLIS